MSSGKWQPFCLSLNVLILSTKGIKPVLPPGFKVTKVEAELDFILPQATD